MMTDIFSLDPPAFVSFIISYVPFEFITHTTSGYAAQENQLRHHQSLPTNAYQVVQQQCVTMSIVYLHE